MSDAPFGLIELITRVGEDHVSVQPLVEVVTNVSAIARPKKRGAPYHPGIRITFLTDQATVAEIGGMSPLKMIPLVLWFPAERVEQAKADRATRLATSPEACINCSESFTRDSLRWYFGPRSNQVGPLCDTCDHTIKVHTNFQESAHEP